MEGYENQLKVEEETFRDNGRVDRETKAMAHDSNENIVVQEKEYINECEICGRGLYMECEALEYETREKYGCGWKAIQYKGKFMCPYCLTKQLWADGHRNLSLTKEDMMEKGMVVKEGKSEVMPSEVKNGKQDTVQSMIIGMIPTAGSLKITEEQKKILFADISDDIVEIRPDGLIYLPWMEYVSRLNQAFNCEWAIIPKDNPFIKDNNVIMGFYLIIQGKLMGYAIGEQAYIPNNPKMTYGDAIEGATSNALMRLCKRIGIGLELWKPSFIRAWKEKYAESCWDTDKYGNKKLFWRRKNGKEISAENGKPIPPKTTNADTDKQKELYQLLIKINNDDKTETELKRILEDITTFTGKDGNEVKGVQSLKDLKGKRLDVTIGKAKKIVEENQPPEDFSSPEDNY
jgi:hypothetical protein